MSGSWFIRFRNIPSSSFAFSPPFYTIFIYLWHTVFATLFNPDVLCLFTKDDWSLFSHSCHQSVSSYNHVIDFVWKAHTDYNDKDGCNTNNKPPYHCWGRWLIVIAWHALNHFWIQLRGTSPQQVHLLWHFSLSVSSPCNWAMGVFLMKWFFPQRLRCALCWLQHLQSISFLSPQPVGKGGSYKLSWQLEF